MIMDLQEKSILIYTCGEFLFIPAVGDLAIEACSLPSLRKKEKTSHFRVTSEKATRLALRRTLVKKSIKVKTIGGENTHFMNVWTKTNLEVIYRDKIFWGKIVFFFLNCVCDF